MKYLEFDPKHNCKVEKGRERTKDNKMRECDMREQVCDVARDMDTHTHTNIHGRTLRERTFWVGAQEGRGKESRD